MPWLFLACLRFSRQNQVECSPGIREPSTLTICSKSDQNEIYAKNLTQVRVEPFPMQLSRMFKTSEIHLPKDILERLWGKFPILGFVLCTPKNLELDCFFMAARQMRMSTCHLFCTNSYAHVDHMEEKSITIC